MQQAYRPHLGFTPEDSWTNDPNGLVYDGKRYHLFYQNTPGERAPRLLYWGHAVSEDLLTWRHLPVAIAPDELGVIFSGGAVYDARNTSGLGTAEQPPIVACFTYHHNENGERQGIAYSTDGVNFAKYNQNPVIPNPGLRDFRDPHPFYDHARGRWALVLAAGDRVHFYASPDLLHWSKTGEFGPEGNRSTGVWECPDLFPLTTPEGAQKWVLLVSMGMAVHDGGSRTQVFVGDFDGQTFVPQPEQGVVWLDQGPDCYAGITFDNAPNGRRVLVSWMCNWYYSTKLPMQPFIGCMSVPRELTLARTGDGLRLAQNPVPEIFAHATDVAPLCDGMALPGDCVGARIRAEGPIQLTLENDRGEKLRFGLSEDGNLFVDRTVSGIVDLANGFAARHTARRLGDGELTLRFVWDVCQLTVWADGGLSYFSTLAFPKVPYQTLRVEGEAEGMLMKISV